MKLAEIFEFGGLEIDLILHRGRLTNDLRSDRSTEIRFEEFCGRTSALVINHELFNLHVSFFNNHRFFLLQNIAHVKT